MKARSSAKAQTASKGANQRLRTREEAYAELHRKGLSVADWARQHQVDASTTYQVLYGLKKGRRGEAHRVAVLLGIKDGVIEGATA